MKMENWYLFLSDLYQNIDPIDYPCSDFLKILLFLTEIIIFFGMMQTVWEDHQLKLLTRYLNFLTIILAIWHKIFYLPIILFVTECLTEIIWSKIYFHESFFNLEVLIGYVWHPISSIKLIALTGSRYLKNH